MVTNGDFKKGLAGWNFQAYNTFKGQVVPKIQRVDGKPTLFLKIPDVGSKTGLFLHMPVPVKEGKTYALSFECRLEGKGKMVMRLIQAKPPYRVNGCSRNLEPDVGWKRFVSVFNTRAMVAENPPGVRLVMGDLVGKLYLRKVSLKAVPSRQLESKNGTLEVLALTGKVKAQPKPPAGNPPAAQLSKGISATALAEAFAEDAAAAKKRFQGRSIRLRGRVSRIEPALLGDLLLELEGGRVNIPMPADAITLAQDRFLKGEMAAARRKARAFPLAELTAGFTNFRDGSVKMRQGKDVLFTMGESLAP